MDLADLAKPLLVLNLLWYGAGFHFFTIRSVAAAKLLVPAPHRDAAGFAIMIRAVKFLGGLNLALALLALFGLVGVGFEDADSQATLLLGLGVGHATQFAFNVPGAREERRGETALWPVTSGSMLFIFVVDAAIAAVDFGFVAAWWIRG